MVSPSALLIFISLCIVCILIMRVSELHTRHITYERTLIQLREEVDHLHLQQSECITARDVRIFGQD